MEAVSAERPIGVVPYHVPIVVELLPLLFKADPNGTDIGPKQGVVEFGPSGNQIAQSVLMVADSVIKPVAVTRTGEHDSHGGTLKCRLGVSGDEPLDGKDGRIQQPSEFLRDIAFARFDERRTVYQPVQAGDQFGERVIFIGSHSSGQALDEATKR